MFPFSVAQFWSSLTSVSPLTPNSNSLAPNSPSRNTHHHRHPLPHRHRRHSNSPSSPPLSPPPLPYSPPVMHQLIPLSQSPHPNRSPMSPMPKSKALVVAHRTSPTSTGGYIDSVWIPFDIWPRIASHLPSVADQIAFYSVCRTARLAVLALHARRLRSVRETFHSSTFVLPPHILCKVLTAHPLPPPHPHALVLFLDASDDTPGRGVDIAWLQQGHLRRAPLGLDSVPASSVSNIVFSPDASRLACLVTLAHAAPPQDAHDPLHRLRGWERVSRAHGHVVDIVYDPCEDCTVQVVDLIPTDDGLPHALCVSTFSHVFVPEYGFDMVWRNDEQDHLELAFAAMLHSAAGAATYLVRWRGFNPVQPHPIRRSSFEEANAAQFSSASDSSATQRRLSFRHSQSSSAAVTATEQVARPNFVFMACIDGASTELLEDKRQAMLTQGSTTCTSRIELSSDAKSIFFDTVSKFGILRFDQVEDSMTARVTRADLSNIPRAPHSPPRRAKRYDLSRREQPSSSPTFPRSSSSNTPTSRRRTALRQLNMGAAAVEEKRQSTCEDKQDAKNDEGMRVSAMSPDGSLLCSLVCVGNVVVGGGGDESGDGSEAGNFVGSDGNRVKTDGLRRSGTRHIEMRSSTTGRLIYRKAIVWPRRQYDHESRDHRACCAPFDKSADTAQHAINFSKDSKLLVLWDAHVTRNRIEFTKNLPLILDARTGQVVQDFTGNIPSTAPVDHAVDHQSQPYHVRRIRRRRSAGCVAKKESLKPDLGTRENEVSKHVYEFAQIAPDGLTVYATRMCAEHVMMDAIDTVSGEIVKTIAITGVPVVRPTQFSPHANFVMQGNILHTISRGWVDALWQTTRGSVGCGWSGRRRLDEHEEYGEEDDDRVNDEYDLEFSMLARGTSETSVS